MTTISSRSGGERAVTSSSDQLSLSPGAPPMSPRGFVDPATIVTSARRLTSLEGASGKPGVNTFYNRYKRLSLTLATVYCLYQSPICAVQSTGGESNVNVENNEFVLFPLTPDTKPLLRRMTSSGVTIARNVTKTMSTAKRATIGTGSAAPKIHPLFTGGLKDNGTNIPSPPTLIHYLHLDPFISSAPVSAVAGPSTPPKKVSVVFYDLDGTLIKTKTNAKFPTSRDDWAWWHPSVPSRLKREHEEGKHLVVISNQGDSREKIRREWKAKLPLITAKLPAGVPLRILAALNKYDIYRKPNIGMFQVVEDLYRERGYEIDLESSLFVGDAAGRLGGRGVSKDHSDTDYKFALNVGIKFLTPEEHFLGDPRPPYPIPPNGFCPAKLGALANLPAVVPSNTPITRPETEIVIFVGPPASGKTSFFRRHFEGTYEHVNQDTLKRREVCWSVAEAFIKQGKSVVVDNTNRDRNTRHFWVAIAARLNVPIRLFHFLCPIELAKHNNVYRAVYAPLSEPKRELLPSLAFNGYAAQFEVPDLKEGFDEIRGVNFVWKGSEEQRKKWDMWMLEPK